MNNLAEGQRTLIEVLADKSVKIPDDVRDTLNSLTVLSPVVMSVEVSELVYARADDLPKEILAIGAQLAMINATYNFQGMGNNGRGAGIAAALAEKANLQPEAKAEAPEPEARFLPQPVPGTVPPDNETGAL